MGSSPVWARRSRHLNRSQIAEDRGDVANLEHEFRHVGMAGIEALGQRLAERVDRIALAKRAKRRGLVMMARAGTANSMAARAMARKQAFAAALGPRSVLSMRQLCRGEQARKGGEQAQKIAFHGITVQARCHPERRLTESCR